MPERAERAAPCPFADLDLHPYPTMSSASVVGRRLTRRGTSLRAFRCRCGRFHLLAPERVPGWARRRPGSPRKVYRNRRPGRVRRVA